MNNFNKVAPYYDNIAQLVFGKSIRLCQLEFIHLIPANAKILILGGGTGWLLQHIIRNVNHSDVTYIEKSKKAEKKTKSLLTEKEKMKVIFVNLPFEEFRNENQYDVVIANFFLDVFSHNQLMDILIKIKDQLKNNGQLLVSDFQINQSFISKLWQKSLSWLMHIFFKITSQLQSNKLQSFSEEIEKKGFVLKEEELFFGKMIFSRVYELEFLK